MAKAGTTDDHDLQSRPDGDRSYLPAAAAHTMLETFFDDRIAPVGSHRDRAPAVGGVAAPRSPRALEIMMTRITITIAT
jgi:hypothetical protein